MRKLLLFVFATLTMVAQAADVSETLQKTDVTSIENVVSYRFNYPSVSVTGEPVVLSAQLIAWNPADPKATDAIETVHIYNHHTVTSDAECPTAETTPNDIHVLMALTRGTYGIGLNEDENFIARSIVIAPDYEGYGVTKESTHPYLAMDVTAQQVVDGVKYGLQLYNKEIDAQKALPFADNWRTFGFGYSQGGAVALAVQRHIEQNDIDNDLHYRGTLAGDGPYDLIATMNYYMQDNGDSYDVETQHHIGTTSMPMVVPMIIKGMIDSHPDMKNHQLEDYLSQQFLDTGIMEWIASKEYKVNDIYKMWYAQLQEGVENNGHAYTSEQMAELFESPTTNKVTGKLDKLFTPGFYDYQSNSNNLVTVPEEKGDAYKDLHRALYDNSVATGWEPQHRIMFIHSKYDVVVPYGNYLSFRDAHPDGEGTLYRIDDDSTSDHVEQGTTFFLKLAFMGSYGSYYKWLDEPYNATGVQVTQCASNTSSLWYTLDGRQLNCKPTTKGVYINNGKKLVVE